MRTARTIPLLLVCSIVVTLGACSSGPAPRAWAAAVCQVLAPWRSEIGTLTTRTQQQMTAETTPAQAKENLTRLFGGAEDASEKARAGVEKAGVPDVDAGKTVSESFLASLSAMRDSYGRAKTGIEALAISPAKDFYTKVGTVVQTLNSEYAASELDTSNLASVELKDAFDEAPECR
ncbi:hypothetical protein GCM10010435_44850 [Winogradskya consettensis]|uniref:Lipoprotein n=2 Tax=Winogradskya TaxID=3240235 RepID=A0A919T3C1_9ACTN|nr:MULTISPECIES: hypothetical protein [Actinoplanes]GIE19661.1 hypothetical protein Ahu01nite_027630 [Actinoplanes humidus]GIM82782.1 hypothetical protein Aco04nite_83240 [Actinoplanes consettensis]